ncbi:MAG: outer membrane beta-barrel protein [Saprospiraceae bacterium]
MLTPISVPTTPTTPPTLVMAKSLTWTYGHIICTQHKILLTYLKELSLKSSGWYSSPSIWGGNFKTKRMGAMDMGLQKKFMEDKATLKIALSDVFKTNEWSFESFYGALYIRGGGGWDSCRLPVNLTYRFGNDQVKGARRRSTGLEDEKKRVKGE